MNKRLIAGLVLFILVMGCALWVQGIIPTVYPPWHGGRGTSLNDPRWKIADARDKWDRSWEGKMPIELYGKVVDEKEQPVAGAKVDLGWTDLSPAGSSQRIITSDVNGLFSIAGVKGKSLCAKATKEGYYVPRFQNRFSFEYASFSDEDFYEPDREKPVLFYLRKKGNAEPLKFREKEFKISVGRPLKIPIDGTTQLLFTLLSNVHPKHGRWEAEVVVQNGGIVPATEEFIVEAPTDGYESKMTIGPQTPKPPTWELYQGGSFYLKTGENYGRLDIEMIPENDWFRVTTWINPKPGSRNVEYDPKKQAPNP